MWPDVWSGDLQVLKGMVIHDTECPYWNQVSFNNTNHKPLVMYSQLCHGLLSQIVFSLQYFRLVDPETLQVYLLLMPEVLPEHNNWKQHVIIAVTNRLNYVKMIQL